MRPRTVWSVIRREYMERALSREFLFSTIAVPILMGVTIAVPAAVLAGKAEEERTLAIVDGTGVLASHIGERLVASGYRVDAAEPGDTTLNGRVLRGELMGYVVVDESTLQEGRAVFRSAAPLSALRRFGIQSGLAQAVLAQRLEGAGEGREVWTLLSGDGLVTEVLSRPELESNEREARLAIGFLGAFVLYGVILLYGQMVRRAVLEEKKTRLVDILLSSIRPSELLLGKIVGVGAVGLTQVMVWVLAGAGILLLGLPLLVALVPEAAELQGALAVLPGAWIWAFFVANFLLGFLLFASLFAVSGAISQGDEDVSHSDLPLMFLIMTPFIYMVITQEQPDTAVSVVMSLVPFFSPILMFNRAVQGLASTWEAALSLVLMTVTLVGVAWFAGRIYRTGILMQGKRVTLPELWRWARKGEG